VKLKLDRNLEGKHCLLAITGAYNLGGGIAAANRLVIQALVDSGYHTHIIAFNEGADSGKHYKTFKNINYKTSTLNKLKFVFHVYSALLKRRYTTIFFDHVNLAWILFPVVRLGFVRYVVRLNGIEVFPPKPDWQGKLGLQNAALCLAISEFTKQQVSSIFPELKITVVDLSLDPVRSEQIQLSDDLIEMQLTAVDGSQTVLGNRVILHVGRMAEDERYKGQDVLIQAMPYLSEEYSDVQLVLVGQGNDMGRLLALAREQSPDVQSRIFMPGFVSEKQLDDLYQCAYLFAMPSRGEGFGLVYVEAMSRGKPCVASRIDAAQFVVKDEVTGLLVNDPFDPKSVATTLLNLLRDPQKARLFGAAGYELAKTYYSYPSFRDRFIETLEAYLS